MIAAVALLALAWALPAPASPGDELVEDRGVVAVRANCVACHSTQLIVQNRGSAQHWGRLIRWMQETQGLWPLPPQTEREIVTYLARNYGPRERHRRSPLPAALMPPIAACVDPATATARTPCEAAGDDPAPADEPG